ncbi:hypothetical protein QTO34_005767 [Cnephaeus nilssonii]|uniref:(E2-independent) E3 ubiquitin-conjugating enzyme FATS n=1 Tax=Cnephaeus nilssonii TaxID=3371016 RepID=A0AA40HLF4_CNENI|nr:hypothetical protein QTO34_005767 [Eptesicus nilssonii]
MPLGGCLQVGSGAGPRDPVTLSLARARPSMLRCPRRRWVSLPLRFPRPPPPFPWAPETLASQDTKMISSLVISQLMEENKPTEKGAAVPVPCAAAQPPTWPGKRALASRSGVTINRAFAFLPGQRGPQPPAGVRGPEPALTPKEERQPGGSPQKGFASITITARRAGTTDLSACTDPSGSSPRMRLEFPEAHARLCDGHQYWVAGVDPGEDRLSPGRPRSGQGPLLFSSCVHLRVSRRCPPDRSLSVPMEPTQPAGPQTHRSVLSLSLNCSSHRLTPDGADGPASGGPISSSLKQQLVEGSGLLGPRWAPALHPSLGQVHLGAGTCPWSGPPLTESTELADAGTRQITARKGEGDHGAPGRTGGHASAHANQLSIHIPGWSYRAGDYTCCDLVVQIKECETREAAAIPGPAPAPAPPQPAPSEEPETPGLREGCSECRPAPASSSLTLQEALEARRPQFISRSQERLKKLELMAQQRRAQRQESPGPKPGPLPVRASRRQFTVPHPLSDNLFKPKERCISEKEMHMRSKRIYNNLPESNRLRAEVFKKQLLDQLLQRNAV